MCVDGCMHSYVQLFVIPWTAAHQAPLSTEFSRQEYCWRLPFPTPGDLPGPKIDPVSLAAPALAGRSFTNCTMWEALIPSLGSQMCVF